MSAEIDIQQALEIRGKELLTPIFGERIAFTNYSFSPDEGTPWARLTNKRAKTRKTTVGVNAQEVHSGFLQISLFFPNGAGLGPALSAASGIKTGLSNAVLVRNQSRVEVQVVSIGNEIEETGWVMLPVTADWVCHSSD